MTENKSKNEKCSHKQEFHLQSRFINNHGNILTFEEITKNGHKLSIYKVCSLLNQLHEENEKLKEEKYAYLGEITLYKGEANKRKKENKKIIDTINNKITEKGMDWYGAEDNSKEEKEANLQLNVLEEIRDELKVIFESN